jgi:hypothetical protein
MQDKNYYIGLTRTGLAEWCGAGLRAGWTGVRVAKKLRISLFTTVSISAVGPTQPPIQWVPGTLSLGLKWLGREADLSPPSNAEVRNAWNIPPLPDTPSCRGARLKHRDNFTFYLLHRPYTFRSKRKQRRRPSQRLRRLINQLYEGVSKSFRTGRL